MRKSLQLQAEMTAGVRRLRVRRHARLRGRRAGRRRAEHAQLVAALRIGAPARQPRVARARACRRPPAFEQDVAIIAGRRRHAPGHVMLPKVESRAGRRAAPCHGARRRRRDAAAAARADRDRPPPCTAPSTSPPIRASQSLSFGLMDFVSAHGGAIPAAGMGVAGPVHASAGGARQAGDRVGLPCARQGAVALRGHRVQGHGRDAARRARAPRANSATRGCGASTPTRSARSSRPWRPARGEIDAGRDASLSAAQAADWAPISHRRQAARPRELPLSLAGAGAGAPDRTASCPPEAQGWFGPSAHDHTGDTMQYVRRHRSWPPRSSRRSPSLAQTRQAGDKPAAATPAKRTKHKLAHSAQKAVEEVTPDRRRPERRASAGRRSRRSPSRCTSATSRASSAQPCRSRRQARRPLRRRAPRATSFLMHPVESRTGAIRLEDPQARRDVAAAGQQVDAHEPEARAAAGRRMPEPAAGHVRRRPEEAIRAPASSTCRRARDRPRQRQSRRPPRHCRLRPRLAHRASATDRPTDPETDGERTMLQAYVDHVAERAALGIPPLPLTAKQTADLIELLKNPPAGEARLPARPDHPPRARRRRRRGQGQGQLPGRRGARHREVP